MSNIKNLKEAYTFLNNGEEPKGGGQGTTRPVVSIGEDKQIVYILKTLNKGNDPERRARMRREYVSLETLAIEGIPKAIDSNTEYFADSEYKLFLVMELISGPTLTEWIERPVTGQFGAESLTGFMNRILKVIDYCHEQGIVHRDMKPDNIILKDAMFSDPWLVDFGQSFNHIEESFTTPDRQIMGNRFLYLPELSTLSGNKRDLRSDLTMAVGLLFYILTGKEPGHLVDENMQLPHQRRVFIDERWKLPEHIQTAIMRLFDKGFQPNINNRFQSAEALTADFIKIMNSNIPSQDTKDRLAKINEERKTADKQELITLDKLLGEVYSLIGVAVGKALGKVEGISQAAGKYIHNIELGLAGSTFSLIKQTRKKRLA